jgi:hypothetical protein
MEENQEQTEQPKEEKDYEEIAKKYEGQGKGRIPNAVSKQVVAINKKKRLIRKTKYGIKETPKVDAFLEEFLKNGGNATQAALSVGSYSSIESAAVAGSNFLKQAKGLARIYMEKNGHGYGKMLDIAMDKLKDSKTPEWWDRLMKMAEYEDFTSKKGGPQAVAVNVFQAHQDLAADYIDGEEVALPEDTEDEDKLP